LRIKRYRGKSVNLLLKEIKSELGSDVEVLETRSVRQQGILGFFLPREIEIAVAFEESISSASDKEISSCADSKQQNVSMSDNSEDTEKTSENRMSQDQCHDNSNTSESGRNSSNNRDETTDLLVARGVPEETASVISVRLNNGRDLAEDLPWMRAVPINPSNGEGRPRVIALVGPTGGGKTTTCAKLAANMSLNKGYSVGLITSDTYRIGAVEQLRKYARILDMNLEVVFSPEELPGALKRLSNVDLVFMDTAGHNPRDEERINRLNDFLRCAETDEIHLVMSAGIDPAEVTGIIRTYRRIGFNRLIISKLDETTKPGRAILMAEQAGVPLSYVCNGQEVPEDIGLAPDVLSETLLEGMV